MDTSKLDLSTAKIIKLVSGEEICCMLPKEQLAEKSKLLRLSEPMLIKYVPHISAKGISDYIALVKWVGFTDDKIVSVPKDKILTICNATKLFTERYNKLKKISTSNQRLPDYVDRELKQNDHFEYDNYEDIKEQLREFEEYAKMPSKKFH